MIAMHNNWTPAGLAFALPPVVVIVFAAAAAGAAVDAIVPRKEPNTRLDVAVAVVLNFGT